MRSLHHYGTITVVMSRWIKFFVAIAFGAVVGLYYAWVISPVEFVDTSPDTLRVDYKADFVLMVAEVYQIEGDLPKAARRLALLGEAPPGEHVDRALTYASQAGYSDSDQALLQALFNALQTWNPEPEALEG